MNAVAQPDIKTPRPIKTLILASLILGQLFVTGYFFNAEDNLSITEQGQQFVNYSALIAICCSLMMLPLKVIISLFLGGKTLTNHVKKEELEIFDKKQNCLLTAGTILICCWACACLYGISMFVISFTSYALEKWLITYFGGIFINVIVMFNLKFLATIIIATFLLKIARCKLMLAIAGSCAGTIVDFFVRLFS